MSRFGIETVYRGTTFRSRTEATWAAFFDELKLRWSYEPCDLDGYIPDFDLLFAKRPLLVEVKGATTDIEPAKWKLECSGWTGDAVIVVDGAHNPVGALFEADIGWDDAALAYCLACKSHTLCSESGRWQCRNCLADSRELWFAYDYEPLWAAAKNATQWRPAA